MAGRRTFPDAWTPAVSSRRGRRLLRVKVAAGSSRNQVVGVHDRRLKVRVTAPAERGKANRAVEKLLSAEAGMPARVVSGQSSPRKEVEFTPGRDSL